MGHPFDSAVGVAPRGQGVPFPIHEYARDPPFLCGPPFPYTLEDSDFWIATGFERTAKNGTPLDLCIRDMTKGGQLIGSVRVGDQSDENLDGDDVG